MRTHDGVDFTVKIDRHRLFLGGILSMEIDDNPVNLVSIRSDNTQRNFEGAIHVVHIDAALQIDHTKAEIPFSENAVASSGGTSWIVSGSEKTFRFIEIFINLSLLPDMISAGDNVDAVGEYLIGKVRGEPESGGGVFSVYDYEIGMVSLYQIFQPDK
jgi:hypothetical protein